MEEPKRHLETYYRDNRFSAVRFSLVFNARFGLFIHYWTFHDLRNRRLYAHLLGIRKIRSFARIQHIAFI